MRTLNMPGSPDDVVEANLVLDVQLQSLESLPLGRGDLAAVRQSHALKELRQRAVKLNSARANSTCKVVVAVAVVGIIGTVAKGAHLRVFITVICIGDQKATFLFLLEELLLVTVLIVRQLRLFGRLL